MIAIIAILAAILFPMFARAREKARQISCLSNMRQVSMAFLMYAQDYDEMGPILLWASMALPTTDCSGVFWARLIQPYLKTRDLFICPTHGRGPEFNDSTCDFERFYWRDLSYSLNGGATAYNAAALPACVAFPRALGEIQTPAGTVLICEATGTGLDGRRAHYMIGGPPGAPAGYLDSDPCLFWGQLWNVIDYRHSETANVGFADGHAKAMKKGVLEAVGAPGTPDYTLWDRL